MNKRRQPEDVAQIIGEHLQGRLTPKQEALLQRVTKGSLKQKFFGYTSMPQDFAKPVGMQRRFAKAEQIFAAAISLRRERIDCPTNCAVTQVQSLFPESLLLFRQFSRFGAQTGI